MSQQPTARRGARKRAPRAVTNGHMPNHRPLVAGLTEVLQLPGERCGVDLVAVPAARPADNLAHAADVAARAGAQLLVMCSRDADPGKAYEIVTDILDPLRVTVVEIPRGWSLPGLELEADRSSLFDGRRSDTHVKRNLAIAVCRAMGFRRLLFLDDDVRGFGASHQESLEGVLADRPGGPAAIGWAFDEFPDNSVVCHAYREAGGPQSTFIGAGALGLRVDAETPHFPRMYNEDWLFLLRLMLRGRPWVVFAGVLIQEAYDPYKAPENAVQQEAGDLIAETLFRRLHSGRSLDGCMEAGFWREALLRRRDFVTEIRAVLARQGTAKAASARKSLETVLDMTHRSSAWPTAIVRWLAAWQRDEAEWSRWLADVLPASSVQAAVRGRGLEPVASVPERAGLVSVGTA